ncbi:MAG: TIM barrel protein [Gammaproteobacteria bacterium]|nr:TIM barrel protein [Gammaproteobacteria bacterium]
MTVNKPKYATRLNSFLVGAEAYWPGKNCVTTKDLLSRAATVPDLNAADLNFPDHFVHESASDLRAHLDTIGVELNGLAMRYYTDPRFKPGALMNPDAAARRAAIDLTKRGLDALAEMDGDLMTLWLGQDGFDYSFQSDYKKSWDDTLEALGELADHNPAVQIALEYKPNEPRAYSLMPDVGTNLLALSEIGRANTGITIDFAHVLYADEMPAHTVTIVNRYSRLLGVQMNDGYGKRDDGLIAGSVHPVQTVELLVELERCGYQRAIYFDTFPDVSALDPVEETRTNIMLVEALRSVAARLSADVRLASAIERQDAALSQRIVAEALYRQA